MNPPINIDAPVLEVRHADLIRVGGVYRSQCPSCPEGVLLVYRDEKTMELREYDCCIGCAQRVRYLDIEEMRARER